MPKFEFCLPTNGKAVPFERSFLFLTDIKEMLLQMRDDAWRPIQTTSNCFAKSLRKVAANIRLAMSTDGKYQRLVELGWLTATSPNISDVLYEVMVKGRQDAPVEWSAATALARNLVACTTLAPGTQTQPRN
jgi:hypothetical protein